MEPVGCHPAPGGGGAGAGGRGAPGTAVDQGQLTAPFDPKVLILTLINL